MKYITKIIATMFVGLGLVSCVDLDLVPKNMMNDTAAFGSLDGVEAYLAQVYYDLPIEDYNFTFARGFNVQDHYWATEASTGESICRDIGGVYLESHDWDYAYKNIRRINYFIENLPKYESYYSPETLKHLLGEGYFLRAYMYYSLAKRYGGVPYIDYLVNYPECGFEGTYIARNSEEETWTMMGEDFQFAVDNMSETSLSAGRANKYVAAAMMSRAMLHAGSIAKYNNISHFDENTQKRVCGIPSDRAKDFFKMAYDAAKICEGKYSLYKKKWVAGDKEAQKDNLIEMFFDLDNSENIFVKHYEYPNTSHSWDRFNLNRIWVADGFGCTSCPTLDFVEMFDGLPKTEDGKFKTLDENDNYILYNDRFDAFKEAEPRLRAQVLVPGCRDFKPYEGSYGKERMHIFDVRRGIYTAPVGAGIKRLVPEDHLGHYPEELNDVLVQSANISQKPWTLPDGSEMNPAGDCGIYSDNAESSYSGFSIRKFLNPDMSYANTYMWRSEQPWVEIRYAEVMLNRAEAAYELHLLGENDVDYVSDAFNLINEIRERAGAVKLNSAGDLNDIDVIRKERRKELAFENKTFWDLRRWRILHEEQTDRVYRTLMPIYVQETGQYFFDARYDEYVRRYTYDQRYYYYPIPGNEITRNPNMCQNAGY